MLFLLVKLFLIQNFDDIMSKTHYVKVLEGKKEYTFEDVKTMDTNTFKSVLGTPKLQSKLSVVPITEQQRNSLKKGDKVSAADLGAVSNDEMKQIAHQKNLLETQVEEQGSEIANLQKQLAALQKSDAPAQVVDTEDTKTAKKK